MSFYHGLHRELDLTPSEVSGGGQYRFRGGNRKMPITEKILRRHYQDEGVERESIRRGGGVGGHLDTSTELDDSDQYVEDSFVVGDDEREDQETAGDSSLSAINLDESSDLVLDNDSLLY